MVTQLLAVGQKKDTLYIEVDLEKVSFRKSKMNYFADSSRNYRFNKKLVNNVNCNINLFYSPDGKLRDGSKKISKLDLKNCGIISIDWFHNHDLNQIDSLDNYYHNDMDNLNPGKRFYLFEKQELEKDSVTIYHIGILREIFI